MRLSDRVAVVTGAAGGLGGAYSVAISREGAIVVATDVNAAGLEQTKMRIQSLGGRCAAYAADLTQEEEVRGLIETAINLHGKIDVLVNNAGGDGWSGPIEELEIAEWNRVFEINLKTAVLCCKAVVPGMKRQRYGRILNVASRAARSTGWYSQVSTAYGCAKASVIVLTRYLAKELGPFGITVNCLVPSFTISGPALQRDWDSMTADEQSLMLRFTPLGRLPEIQELASVVVFLCSDESSYMTGTAIDVNGGSFMS